VFQDVHPAFGKVVAKPGWRNLQGELVYPHRVVVGHRAVLVADGKDPGQVRTLGADEGATGFCRFLGDFPVHLRQKYGGNITVGRGQIMNPGQPQFRHQQQHLERPRLERQPLVVASVQV